LKDRIQPSSDLSFILAPPARTAVSRWGRKKKTKGAKG
jgi:hypothetical protein